MCPHAYEGQNTPSWLLVAIGASRTGLSLRQKQKNRTNRKMWAQTKTKDRENKGVVAFGMVGGLVYKASSLHLLLEEKYNAVCTAIICVSNDATFFLVQPIVARELMAGGRWKSRSSDMRMPANFIFPFCLSKALNRPTSVGTVRRRYTARHPWSASSETTLIKQRSDRSKLYKKINYEKTAIYLRNLSAGKRGRNLL